MSSRNCAVVKECPVCGHAFERGVSMWKAEFGKRVKCCPKDGCNEALHYVKQKGKVVAVIPLNDKVCVDNLIGIICKHKSNLHGFNFNLGDVTARERKFAYELIDWCRGFMDQAMLDLGMSVYEFLERWLKWVLERPWWSTHFESLLMLRGGERSRLVVEFYDEYARENGITAKGDEVRLRRILQRTSANLDLALGKR